MNEIKVINKSFLLGKEIDVYGSVEEPLFLATDVADWIEHTNVTEMLRGVDDDEKLTSEILRAGQRRNCNLLTEEGLYEVLMQSTKPVAKQFKKGVKEILKTIRKTEEYLLMKMHLGILKYVAKEYSGKTIDNIIQQIESRIKEYE